MTLASDLIQSAYREGNLIPVGTSPTAAEQTEALDVLNRFINGIFGNEMGENLADWLFPAPQRTATVAANFPQFPGNSNLLLGTSSAMTPYPPANSRVVWGVVTGKVYFPERPEPGARMAFVQASGAGDAGAAGQILTLDGNGRQIQDPADKAFKNTVALTAPAAGAQWFYRDDLGQWALCQDVAAGDPSPFPKEFDDFFICALSKRLAPRYSKITANETIAQANKTLMALKARYRQTAPTVYGSENIPNSEQTFRSGWLSW